MNPEAVAFEKLKVRHRFFQTLIECAVLAFVFFALGSLWYPGDEWDNLTRALVLAVLVGLIERLAALWWSVSGTNQQDLPEQKVKLAQPDQLDQLVLVLELPDLLDQKVTPVQLVRKVLREIQVRFHQFSL